MTVSVQETQCVFHLAAGKNCQGGKEVLFAGTSEEMNTVKTKTLK
jgi:hypothetical protein